MFIMSYHFQRENVIVMINKYFYQTFFMDPDVQDSHREEKVSAMHETSMKFIAQYLNLGSLTGNVQSAEFDELVQECFPDLQPFLMEQRSVRRENLQPSMNSVDYDALSLHLFILTTTDWMALFRVAELEENRRGRALR